MLPFYNEKLLADESSRKTLRQIAGLCEDFARAMPPDETAQAEALQAIIARAGAEVRGGALRLAETFAPDGLVVRLYKQQAGAGRIKLQLFPLATGDAHPPHAHYNLVSCQVAIAGRARIREYSLLRRLDGDELEICQEPEKILEPGDGVFTLQRRNNIHWQEGLAPGTVLLNINWQGFFADNPMAPDRVEHGRCYIDWDRARPGGEPGRYIVPEVLEAIA